MSKISELSDGSSLQSTDSLIAVRSGGNVRVKADGALTLTNVTLSGSLTLGSTAVTSTAAELNVLDPALKESDSIYIGSDPSGTTDTANYNTALGTSALDGITTGDNNTAVGRAALTDLTTASYTTAIGAYAGEKVSTGSGEGTFVGAFAGEEVTSAVYNTAIGYNAGGGASASASTAGSNTSVGHSALEAVTSGHSNAVLGKNAALLLTESDKTAFMHGFHSSYKR